MSPPRLKQTLTLWWPVTWRVVLYSIIIGGALSFLWGTIAGAAGIGQFGAAGGKVLMALSNILVSIYVLYTLMHKGFGKDRSLKITLQDTARDTRENTDKGRET